MRERWVLGALLAASLLARLGYVAALPEADPAFARPQLDGAVYWSWARALAAGEGSPAGAYYHAPLYPFVLAAVQRLVGERFLVVYALQQLAVVATAWILGRVAARYGGPGTAATTAAIVLLYHPTTFFAARPIGETLAMLLLGGALALTPGPGFRPAFGGALAGLSALARPNLLLVPVAWSLHEACGRKAVRRAALVALGLAAAIAPVALRNAIVSGHLVPISSNAGITAWHGNGPGATGTYGLHPGFSGAADRQREEATALARARSGEPLDDVEADRYWGRAALAERLARPAHTFGLLGWRAMLLLDNREHALDMSPGLDRNPWRPTWRLPGEAEWGLVPFAVVFALAAAGLCLRGFEGTGGGAVWSAIAGAAVGPLAFYVSSRYRLPFAELLAIPAGIGAVALARSVRTRAPWRGAAIVAFACFFGSLAVPSARLYRAGLAAERSNLSAVWLARGELAAAEREARAAIELDPRSARARHNLGVAFARQGREDLAIATYREALDVDPGLAESAANLAALWIRAGDPARALPVLRRALDGRPAHAACWNNLVVALAATGDVAGARQAIAAAESRGVAIDAELRATVEGEGRP